MSHFVREMIFLCEEPWDVNLQTPAALSESPGSLWLGLLSKPLRHLFKWILHLCFSECLSSQGKGRQQDQLRLLQGEVGAESLPSCSPTGRSRGEPLVVKLSPPQTRGRQPALGPSPSRQGLPCSVSPLSLQAEPRPTRPLPPWCSLCAISHPIEGRR